MITREFDKTKNRITKKILRYGERYIRDPDNVMALEISMLVDDELGKLRDKLCRRKK